MAQKRTSHFLTGAIIGVGLGILLAPEKGSKTREELKKNSKALLEMIKDIDLEETKENISQKFEELKKDLANLNKEEAKEILEEKKEFVESKCNEIIEDNENFSVVEKAAEKVKEKTNKVVDGVIEEINSSEELPKNPKKKKTEKKWFSTNFKNL